MAYNNGFPVTYQPYYQAQYQQVQTQAQPQQQGGIIWIQGEAGAKSYLIAPNTTVALWDSEAQVIYLKSADASGMPSMKILDYQIREQKQPKSAQISQFESDKYVTKEELKAYKDALEKRLESLRKGIDDESAV